MTLAGASIDRLRLISKLSYPDVILSAATAGRGTLRPGRCDWNRGRARPRFIQM